ncbi:TetR/AcrR family transcriptional regulator [Zhihengliuella sp.]|uniref:TetR/AcrR family transcriptional regulator n=1 Tax=Zhihengliuella sp. TaxID=1954483 RepID=UPI00281196B2|nr:TetR/AcrR family transcriptional regulator [Zhihengliuella sp.]
MAQGGALGGGARREAEHDGGSAPTREVVRRPGRTNATRLKIFEASLSLIGERGHHAVTVDEIAAAAGVSKGSVYYNFGSKSDLIGQLLRFGTDILLDRLQSAGTPSSDPGSAATLSEVSPTEAEPAGPPSGTPDVARDRLAHMVRAALRFVDEYPAFAQLWISEMWHAPSDWRDVLVELRGEVLGVVRSAVGDVFRERGHADGDLPAGTVDVTASAVFGATLILAQDRQVFAVEHGVDVCVRTVLGCLDAVPPAG